MLISYDLEMTVDCHSRLNIFLASCDLCHLLILNPCHQFEPSKIKSDKSVFLKEFFKKREF